MTTMTHFAQN